MKRFIQIFVFILSLGMLVSPAMTYAATSAELEAVGGCCANKEDNHENHIPKHETDEEGKCHHDQNDCCGTNCPNKDCCLHLNVYQPLSFHTNILDELEIHNGYDEVENHDFYKFFHYKELIFSVWQPPKLFS